MQKEKQHEKKNKEMRAVLEKLNKVKKTRNNLRHSLASSRQSSPLHSPRPEKKSRKVSRKPEEKHKASTAKMRKERETSREECSEYSQVLNSILALKQGNNEYAEIMANAMDATDNLFALENGQRSKISDDATLSKKVGQNHKDVKKAKKANVDTGGLLDIIDKYANKQGASEDGQLASALLGAL